MTKKKENLKFPVKDDKFDSGFTQLMIHLSVPDPTSGDPTIITYVRLALNTTTQYAPLLDILGNSADENSWLYVYPLAAYKPTRTEILVAQKKSLKKQALAIIRAIRLALKAYDKTSPGFLSEADNKYFYMPVLNPRTNSAETFRITAPVPLLSFDDIKHLEHVLDAHDPSEPKSTGLPESVQFIWLKIFIGTVAPTDESQFTHLLFSGKFRNLSTFTSANAGKTAWYTAAYISVTGEVGGWSPFVSSTISKTD